jgi:hypothetical protein
MAHGNSFDVAAEPVEIIPKKKAWLLTVIRWGIAVTLGGSIALAGAAVRNPAAHQPVPIHQVADGDPTIYFHT